jgi:nicotinamidase-related amidase
MMHMYRDRSQLVVIDVQERLLPAMQDPDGVVTNCRRMIQAARRLGIPATVSEQYPRGIGPTVEPLRGEAGGDVPVLPKMHFSCLRDGALRDRFQGLRGGGRNQAVLAGIESHVCVTQTALDFIAAGYETFVVADAVSSRAAHSRDFALHRLRQAGAVIVTCEMALFEWLEMAGTPEFKDLLALVK